MKAAEDFLNVAMCAHVTIAAKQVMNESRCSSPDSKPIAESIVNKFVNISVPDHDGATSTDAVNVDDCVFAYATDFLTLALLLHGFHDAIKMGDTNRMLS